MSNNINNIYDGLDFNDRQRDLLDLLEKNGDKYSFQIDVAVALSQHYPFDRRITFHDSLARHTMTKDIRKINENYDYSRIIISDANGIKLANKDEFKSAMVQEFGMIFRKLNRARIKKEKGGLNGQMKLPLFFKSEEEFIKAFVS